MAVQSGTGQGQDVSSHRPILYAKNLQVNSPLLGVTIVDVLILYAKNSASLEIS
jgi:hypothetical protein